MYPHRNTTLAGRKLKLLSVRENHVKAGHVHPVPFRAPSPHLVATLVRTLVKHERKHSSLAAVAPILVSNVSALSVGEKQIASSQPVWG